MHVIAISFLSDFVYFFRLSAAFSVQLLFFSTTQRIAQAIINHIGGPEGTAVAFSHEYFTTQHIKCGQSEMGVTNYWDHALLCHFLISWADAVSRALFLTAKGNVDTGQRFDKVAGS